MPKRRSNAVCDLRMPSELAGVPSDTAVLLALSGGADSRALLHLLAGAAAEQGFSLTLAHVNHSIRGEEALRDRDFCQRLADEYRLEIVFLDADVPRLAAEHHRGLEEEARAVRYAFFERLMKERGIPLLVTAHHADDLLETLLFRISRGTGTRGLSPIAPCRRFANGFLTRPLLEVTRREILDYCEQNRLAYVQDSTNFDTAYARNRIRHEVVPVLESLYGQPQKRAVTLARELREDGEYLERLAMERLEQCRTLDGLSVDALLQTPMPIRRRVLRMWAERVCASAIQRVQLDALLRLASGETPTARVALPGGLSAVSEMGALHTVAFSDRSTDTWGAPFCEGVSRFEELGVTVTVARSQDAGATKVNNLSTVWCTNLKLESAIIEKALYWRTYREGDVILCHGMHKKLRRLYREAGIPPRLRKRIPLLCDGEGIVWAPFSAERDGCGDALGEPCVIRVVLDGVTDAESYE